MEFIEWLYSGIRDPGVFIAWGGYPALALIIFLETGALVFFLPGDSLLAVAGLYAANRSLDLFGVPGILLLQLLAIPAILGDATSYYIGRKSGPAIFNKPRSRLFKPEHLHVAKLFYEKHGGKAIIIARFMPIVRTFVPIIAGVAQMPYRRFATFNIVGGVAWITSMTLIGYGLGSFVPDVGKHIEKLILLIVFLSILPGLIEWVKQKRRKRAAAT